MKYDTVPSEILLESFKRLDCKERVRARIVCKEWLNIIDENRSLWRSLDCSVALDDGAEPKALILFDEKSQSTLEDVSIYMTYPTEGQEPILDTLFNTLEKSNKTLQSVILKAEYPHLQVGARASQVPLDCPNLNTFMLFDPLDFYSNVVILPRKGCDKDTIAERSKLRIVWTSLPNTSSLNCPRFLENLVSLAVEWYYYSSEWRELLQDSARSLKHLIIRIRKFSGGPIILPVLTFPNLKVLESECDDDKFPEWMVIPSTAILVLRACSVKENLPLINGLWVSWLHQSLNLGKCCPSLGELRISNNGLAIKWGRRAILDLLYERKKQVDIGFEVAGVRMVPLKRIVLSFKDCEGGFLDEVRRLVEEVVDLAEVPNRIPVYI